MGSSLGSPVLVAQSVSQNVAVHRYSRWSVRALLLGNDVRERQNELPRLVAQRHEAVVTEEGLRLLVLGVNHERKNGDFRSQGSLDGIP